jgi:aspartyl aminopeptidase
MKAFAPNFDESPDQHHQGLFEGGMVLTLAAQKSVCANGND